MTFINKLPNTAVIFLGGLIFMLLALSNGYPIVTSDTGTYISSGFELCAPQDRPIFYGLFIRASSLGVSLWLTIYAQCLMLSYVFVRLLTALVPAISNAHKVCFLVFASLCTTGGWFASQIMPDVFVPVMTMAVLIILKGAERKKERFVMMGICLLALITHNSNYITLTLFSALLLLASFLSTRFKLFRIKALSLLGTCLAAWILLCSSNYLERKEFTASNSTHVFIMGKLVESGVLKTYLDKACPVYDYRICPYKDSLPPVAWGFVWDDASPLQKTGGWEANRTEYNKIIRDITSRPKYWPYLMFKSGEATLRQLILINIDGVFELDWIKYLNGSPPFEAVYKYFPHEINELRASKENNNGLRIQFMNAVFGICLVISSLTALLVMQSSVRREMNGVVLFLIILIVLNAFTTATFANVLTRLNARVIWLIPVVNAIYIYKSVLFLKGRAAKDEAARD
jgi:hypothetical protein